MNREPEHNKDLLPYPIISRATKGDAQAINKVLKHYESYILALSSKIYYDHTGAHFCIDQDLVRRLETKLITKILDFKAA